MALRPAVALPRPRWTGRSAQLVVLVVAVLGWWLLSGIAPPDAVPSPPATAVALGAMLGTAQYWSAIAETAWTWVLGMGCCIVVGIPVGLAIGANRFASASTRLVIDFLRTIPPVALVPLGLLLYGPTRPMVLLLVVCGAIWPLLVQAVYAAAQVDAQLGDVARSFRLGRRYRLLHIFVPSALPFLMTGLRITATICLLLTVTGELFGGAPGLGNEIQSALNGVLNAQMYGYVLTSALLGVLVNVLLARAQRRVLRWHPSVRTEKP
jgi:ABC-type nitrate/sulfonate/bicarbonate transport system permease component